LVRPAQGRYLAGVCASIGRATNTDPVLWRVLLAVLVVFGGVGLLAYLIGWLLIPAEGDTTSPVEGLFGRAGSTTPVPLVILLALAAILTFAFVVSNGLQPAVLGVVVILGVIALLTRNGRVRRSPVQHPWGGPPPATATAGPTTPPPPAYPMPMPMPAPQPTGYRPPFAPHGPYVSTPAPSVASVSPYAASLGNPPAPTTDQPPPGPPPPGAQFPGVPYPGTPYPGTPYPGLGAPVVTPKPPKPRRPKSRLGRITLFVAIISLGVLAAIDMGGRSVPGESYTALALAVIGLGLLVGSWLGRARWLIPIGAILSLFLGVGTVVGDWDRPSRIETISQSPTTVDQIEPSYTVDWGEIRLDLSDVDFSTSAPVRVFIAVSGGGTAQVILPPNVDADVDARIDLGDVNVFDNHWGGVEHRRRTITDLGVDGSGGGRITLDIEVGLGEVKVTR
jgi:phage shock protein PspC (stress-responsive transcriptional regulator)